MMKRILAGAVLLAGLAAGSGCGCSKCLPTRSSSGCCPPANPCCPPGTGGAVLPPPPPATAGYVPAGLYR